ncbi:MAG TPA: glycerol-3-phosphate dehydrogenase [Dongiaceae bacterium]|nr:glycerol-3-phosphate dehydrogenase [Dongiaceae bacterium]
MLHTPSSVCSQFDENSTCYDLFIVGGGINGTGIAADATGRGLSVALCEQDDLASATSSASSKLIHGGLRYLEHYEFRLVREALAEREILLANAPHLIKPLRFVLPHRPHLRPAWMIRIGLFLYDHLSRRNRLPASRGLRLNAADAANPLNDSIHYGFEYADCRVDDARLVVANALAAQQAGAQIWVRTRCIGAVRKDGLWHISLQDLTSGLLFQCRARALVNAAGPWAQRFIEQNVQVQSPRRIKLIKGSHFVVPKLYEGDQAYILQNEDQRIVFVIPYNGDFTLVGTTDKAYNGDPAQVAMDADEESYLLSIVNRHFKHQLNSSDIRWRYSGVRPLCDDESDSPSAMTRDYTLETQADDQGQAPLLSIFGGKITTYRRLAEAAMAALKPWFATQGNPWTRNAPLPGGDIGNHDFNQWLHDLRGQYNWLPETLLQRLANAYGTRTHVLLEGCASLADLGEDFGAGLYQREVEFLLRKEWARSANDILWRRSKLGLYFDAGQTAHLEMFVQSRLADMAPSVSPASAPDPAISSEPLRRAG